MFYVPNLASLVPTSIWPGTEGNRKLPTRSEATVGEFERSTLKMLQVGKASSWSTGSVS